jgi:hypothetical protein
MGCVSSTEHAELQQKCAQLEASLQASTTLAADSATRLQSAVASLAKVWTEPTRVTAWHSNHQFIFSCCNAQNKLIFNLLY